jgi:hypothetical protein
MTTQTSLITACALALGLAAGSATMHAATFDQLTYLTFSGPVALPGVTLAPGTYAFDILNSDSGANVVRVRNQARNRTYFLGLTNRIDRPFGMASNRRVALGEARIGNATPIVAWYPSDDVQGRSFLYAKAR